MIWRKKPIEYPALVAALALVALSGCQGELAALPNDGGAGALETGPVETGASDAGGGLPCTLPALWPQRGAVAVDLQPAEVRLALEYVPADQVNGGTLRFYVREGNGLAVNLDGNECTAAAGGWLDCPHTAADPCSSHRLGFSNGALTDEVELPAHWFLPAEDPGPGSDPATIVRGGFFFAGILSNALLAARWHGTFKLYTRLRWSDIHATLTNISGRDLLLEYTYQKPLTYSFYDTADGSYIVEHPASGAAKNLRLQAGETHLVYQRGESYSDSDLTGRGDFDPALPLKVTIDGPYEVDEESLKKSEALTRVHEFFTGARETQ